MMISSWFQILIAFFMLTATSSCQGPVDLNNDNVHPGKQKEDEERAYTQILRIGGYQYPEPQGGDCWGDLFFQFTSFNSCVRVYDLALKKLIQTVEIPSSERGFVKDCHCNTVCFGSDYYDLNDEFPLIYVSTGNAYKGYTGALVYRILRDQDQFSFTLVQTILFPEDRSSWTEFVPAGDYAYLCYTTERVIFKFPMPKLENGNIVVLSRLMAMESYQFSPQPDWMFTSRNQDRLFHEGKILYISGVPTAEASVFVELNLETLERDRIINFQEIGLLKESESLFSWRGDICVAFLDQIVILK